MKSFRLILNGYQFKLIACQRGMYLYGAYMYYFGVDISDVRTTLN